MMLYRKKQESKAALQREPSDKLSSKGKEEQQSAMYLFNSRILTYMICRKLGKLLLKACLTYRPPNI